MTPVAFRGRLLRGERMCNHWSSPSPQQKPDSSTEVGETQEQSLEVAAQVAGSACPRLLWLSEKGPASSQDVWHRQTAPAQHTSGAH